MEAEARGEDKVDAVEEAADAEKKKYRTARAETRRKARSWGTLIVDCWKEGVSVMILVERLTRERRRAKGGVLEVVVREVRQAP